MRGLSVVRLASLFLSVLLGFTLLSCSDASQRQTLLFQGSTMGTFYSVKVITNKEADTAILEKGIAGELERVNQLMSNWQDQSDVSKFNRLPANTWITVDPHTAKVTATALKIAALTKGAYDPTVSPLIELWGFGTRKNEIVPTDAEISAAKKLVGYHLVEVQGNQLRKTLDGVQLNLSSLAKGYAGDLVAQFLISHGYNEFMVNIGGDGVVKGHNLDGNPWRVAIEAPETDRLEAVYKVTELVDVGYATSGDYRNYFTYQGTHYSHLVDPVKGWPIPNLITSVTIIAQDGMWADALATALSIMDPTEGIALVESLPHVQCLLLLRGANGGLEERISSGMSNYLSKE